MKIAGKRIGFAMTGSHCTYEEVLPEVKRLVQAGANVVPIVTHTVLNTGTRFGGAGEWAKELEEVTGNQLISTIPEAEPLGPKDLLDLVVIAPCTGNTMAKLANALTESPVLMAAKAMMRNHKPVVLAISTNDGLGLNMANLARLMVAKDLFFVPFGQDQPEGKPKSLVAQMDLILETCEAALAGKQLQPVIIEKFRNRDNLLG